MIGLVFIAILLAMILGFLPELLKTAVAVLIVAFVVVPIVRFCMNKFFGR